MRIKINTELLIKEVNKIIKVTNLKNPIPYLTGVMIKVNKNNIILNGTDSIISIQSTIEKTDKLELIKTGSVLINCDFLLSILKKIEDKNIEIIKIDNRLVLKTLNFYSEINCFDIDNFPNLDFKISGKKISLKTQTLTEIYEKTIFSINPNEKRNILKGINFKKKKDTLLITTTDSFRLSMIKIPIKDNNSIFETTLPSSFFDLIYKIINNSKEEKIEFFFDNDNVIFLLKNVIIKSKLILGQFPDAERILPKIFQSTITIKTKFLQKIIERVTSLSLKSFENNILKFIVNNKKFLISSNINQVAKSEEKIFDYEFIGIEQEISLNGKYLLDAVKSFNDSEKIEINIVDNNQPIIFNLPKIEKYIQLILPIKTY